MRDVATLQRIARELRMDIVEMIYRAASGHPGGSLSIAELLTALYFDEMNHSPDRKGTPGVDASTGSLGLGVSAACGMAKAAKIYGDSYRVYTLLGDGEMEEGSVWEALMFAAHYKLDNLCVMVDQNGLQIDGPVCDVMNVQPLDQKLAAFGFEVAVIDGHDFPAIFDAFDRARRTKGAPFAIVAKTVKGKGVSFMENNASWHGSAPNAEQYEQAMAELGREEG